MKRYIYLYEWGNPWDSPHLRKVFSSLEKARLYIPKGFEEKKIGGYLYYAESKKEWISIKRYEIE